MHRACHLLLLLHLVRAAPAPTPLARALVNKSVEQLNWRQEVVDQVVKLNPTELQQEHYGRLQAKHPVRHCCMGEACAATRARVAVVASLRRCALDRESLTHSPPECQPACCAVLFRNAFRASRSCCRPASLR